jgi:hypothetical protein
LHLNWAFRNSQVVADAIGTVTLSGLQTDNSANGHAAFGIKIHTPGATVIVLKADAPANPPSFVLGTNLKPKGTALAGDFYYLNV